MQPARSALLRSPSHKLSRRRKGEKGRKEHRNELLGLAEKSQSQLEAERETCGRFFFGAIIP